MTGIATDDAPDPAVVDTEVTGSDETSALPAESQQNDTGAPATEGQPRDEHGRFAPKTAQEAAADSAEQPPDSAVSTGSVDAAVPGAVVAPQPAPDAPAPEPTPFAVRVFGQDYAMPGATLQADGSAVFSPEAVQQVHQLFGRAIALHRREQEINQHRTELRAKSAEIEASDKVLADEWEKLKAVQTLEEFQERAAELWLNRQVIDDRRALAKERARLTAMQEPPPVSPHEAQDSVERDLEASLADDLKQLQASPWAKPLTREDWKWMADQAWAIRGQFVVQQQDGVYYNSVAAQQYVEAIAKRIVAEREKASATARQAQDAEKKNAAAKINAVAAPPSVGTKSPASQPAAPKAQAPSKPDTAADRAASKRREKARFEHWRDTGEWKDLSAFA